MHVCFYIGMYHDLYPGTLCLLYLSKACGEEEALPMRGCKVNFVIFIIYFKCLQGKTRKKEKKKDPEMERE